MCTGPERLKWMLAIVFPLVYFWFVSNQNIVFGRYLLPLIPFLSLLAAAAVVWIVGWLRQIRLPRQVRNVATVALTLAAIAPPAYTAIGYDANAAKVWTTQQAYEWIRRELPAGTTIRLEGSLAIKLPATYRTSYVKQLRLDGVEFYAGTGIQYLVASSQCYGRLLQGSRSSLGRGRGLPADLRADRRSRAIQGDERASGLGAHHPEGEALTRTTSLARSPQAITRGGAWVVVSRRRSISPDGRSRGDRSFTRCSGRRRRSARWWRLL